MIDVVTNIGTAGIISVGKTGGIDVRHFERFLRVLGFKVGKEAEY